MLSDLFEPIAGTNFRQHNIFSSATHQLVQIMDDGEQGGCVFFLLYFEADNLIMIEQPRAGLSKFPKVPYIARNRHGFYR